MHKGFVVKITGYFIAFMLFMAQNAPFTKKWFTNAVLLFRKYNVGGYCKKKANAENSTFANHTSQHTTEVCKRAVFLPTHFNKCVTLVLFIC